MLQGLAVLLELRVASERRRLRGVLEAHGASVVSVLSPETNLLVTTATEFEKRPNASLFRRAKKWGIPIVEASGIDRLAAIGGVDGLTQLRADRFALVVHYDNARAAGTLDDESDIDTGEKAFSLSCPRGDPNEPYFPEGDFAVLSTHVFASSTGYVVIELHSAPMAVGGPGDFLARSLASENKVDCGYFRLYKEAGSYDDAEAPSEISTYFLTHAAVSAAYRNQFLALEAEGYSSLLLLEESVGSRRWRVGGRAKKDAASQLTQQMLPREHGDAADSAVAAFADPQEVLSCLEKDNTRAPGEQDGDGDALVALAMASSAAQLRTAFQVRVGTGQSVHHRTGVVYPSQAEKAKGLLGHAVEVAAALDGSPADERRWEAIEYVAGEYKRIIPDSRLHGLLSRGIPETASMRRLLVETLQEEIDLVKVLATAAVASEAGAARSADGEVSSPSAAVPCRIARVPFTVILDEVGDVQETLVSGAFEGHFVAGFALERAGEPRGALRDGERLVFHGIRAHGLLSILTRGLAMPDEAEARGVARTDHGLLGRGIYFAVHAQDALRYCGLGRSAHDGEVAVVLVCAVSARRPRVVRRPLPEQRLAPDGYDGIFAPQGRFFPHDMLCVYGSSAVRLRYALVYRVKPERGGDEGCMADQGAAQSVAESSSVRRAERTVKPVMQTPSNSRRSERQSQGRTAAVSTGPRGTGRSADRRIPRGIVLVGGRGTGLPCMAISARRQHDRSSTTGRHHAVGATAGTTNAATRLQTARQKHVGTVASSGGSGQERPKLPPKEMRTPAEIGALVAARKRAASEPPASAMDGPVEDLGDLDDTSDSVVTISTADSTVEEECDEVRSVDDCDLRVLSSARVIRALHDTAQKQAARDSSVLRRLEAMVPDDSLASVQPAFASQVDTSKRRRVGLYAADGSAVPLVSAHVHCEILDGTAELVVIHEYLNGSATVSGGEFVCAVSETTAVCGLDIYIGSKHIVGEVKPRARARAEYRAAVARGDGAYLLERDETDRDAVRLAVGNLPPQQRVCARVRMVCELENHSGVAEWAFPPQAEEGVTAPLHIRIVGREASPVTRVWCGLMTSNSVQFRWDGTSWCGVGVAPAANAFLVRISTADPFAPRLWMETDEDGHGAAMLTLFAPQGESAALEKPVSALGAHRQTCGSCGLHTGTQKSNRCPMCGVVHADLGDIERHVVIILDASCSMRGDAADTAVAACVSLVNATPASVAVEGVAFGSAWARALGSFVRNDARTQSSLRRFFVQTVPEMGGTSLSSCLEALCASESVAQGEQGVPTDVFVVSDGELADRVAALSAVSRLASLGWRFFALGAGGRCARASMQWLARVGGGAVCWAPASADAPEAARRLAAAAEARSAGAPQLHWHSRLTPEQAPAAPAPLFAQERCRLYAFVDPDCPGVSVRLGDARDEFLVEASASLLVRGERIHRLAARALVLDASAGVLGASEAEAALKRVELRQRATDLAVTYGLASEFTSFLAIEERRLTDESHLQETPDAASLLPSSSEIDALVASIESLNKGLLSSDASSSASDECSDLSSSQDEDEFPSGLFDDEEDTVNDLYQRRTSDECDTDQPFDAASIAFGSQSAASASATFMDFARAEECEDEEESDEDIGFALFDGEGGGGGADGVDEFAREGPGRDGSVAPAKPVSEALEVSPERLAPANRESVGFNEASKNEEKEDDLEKELDGVDEAENSARSAPERAPALEEPQAVPSASRREDLLASLRARRDAPLSRTTSAPRQAGSMMRGMSEDRAESIASVLQDRRSVILGDDDDDSDGGSGSDWSDEAPHEPAAERSRLTDAREATSAEEQPRMLMRALEKNVRQSPDTDSRDNAKPRSTYGQVRLRGPALQGSSLRAEGSCGAPPGAGVPPAPGQVPPPPPMTAASPAARPPPAPQLTANARNVITPAAAPPAPPAPASPALGKARAKKKVLAAPPPPPPTRTVEGSTSTATSSTGRPMPRLAGIMVGMGPSLAELRQTGSRQESSPPGSSREEATAGSRSRGSFGFGNEREEHSSETRTFGFGGPPPPPPPPPLGASAQSAGFGAASASPPEPPSLGGFLGSVRARATEVERKTPAQAYGSSQSEAATGTGASLMASLQSAMRSRSAGVSSAREIGGVPAAPMRKQAVMRKGSARSRMSWADAPDNLDDLGEPDFGKSAKNAQPSSKGAPASAMAPVRGRGGRGGGGARAAIGGRRVAPPVTESAPQESAAAQSLFEQTISHLWSSDEKRLRLLRKVTLFFSGPSRERMEEVWKELALPSHWLRDLLIKHGLNSLPEKQREYLELCCAGQFMAVLVNGLGWTMHALQGWMSSNPEPAGAAYRMGLGKSLESWAAEAWNSTALPVSG